MSALDFTSIWRPAAGVNPDGQLGRLTASRTAPLLLITLASAAALFGCSAFDREDAHLSPADVSATISAAEPISPASRYSVLQVDPDRPYTGLGILQEPPAELPPRYLEADAVSLSLATATNDTALAALIEAATGLPVGFVGSRPVDAPADEYRPTDASLPEGGIWTGPLDALLNDWTTERGYAWRYLADEERLEVTRSQAVVFRLNALAGTQTVSADTSTSESGGGAGAQNLARQSITSSSAYDIWTDITTQITGLLDPSARITAAPATASVTVSGLPRDIDRARNYLTWLNRTTLRPVTLSVDVYSVTYSSSSMFEIGIAGTLERLLGASAGLQVINDQISVVRPSPGIDSLAATVGAMQSAGTVSRMLTASVPSLNAQPAQFFELFSEAYLREIRTTVTEGLLQTTLVPGTVSSGFAITYVGQIITPNEVLVRLITSILDRPAFNVFDTQGLRLQLPSYGNRAIQITQRVARGETLVITGFRDRSATADNDGTFDPEVPLPFGGREDASSLKEQVLLIRAEAGPPLGVVERQGEVL